VPPSRKPESPQKGPRKPLPEELARDAIAHEDEAPGDKVRMTFRVMLTREQAEALAARAIREEKNLDTWVAEILETAARERRS
jgi:predicted HicB family RNase H-like nuclease